MGPKFTTSSNILAKRKKKNTGKRKGKHRRRTPFPGEA